MGLSELNLQVRCFLLSQSVEVLKSVLEQTPSGIALRNFEEFKDSRL